MEDDKKKKTKEERQAERQAQREERQTRREEHREYVKENGTAIGNELRALGKGLKEEWQGDMNAIKGRRNGDPATKTTEESPEAPTPETTQTQTTETPAQTQTPATTQTQTTAAENAEQTEETQPKEEVSPAPTTEETAVEKTDETDVDGATGVVGQETGNAEQVVAQNATAIPTTETEDAQNQGLEGQNSQSTGDAGQVVASSDAVSDAASQNLANADNNATDNNEGGDNSAPAPDTNGRSGGSASGTRTSVQTPYEFTPETYNPDEDPNVIAIRNANQTMEDAYLGKILKDKDGNPRLDENGDVMRDDSGKLAKFDAMMEDFKKYDEERTRRDAANAFWRGVGEAGGALVNFLGVSGAFGGRNAYGRGAYSSMQKFDLTTGKLTDKMRADMDKRKERMDALRDKQRELGLQFAAVMAKGKENEGKAAAEGQKAVDQRNLTREGWKFTSTENAWQREWQGKENDKNRAVKGGDDKEKDKVYDTFSYYIKGGGGKKKHLVAERKSLDHAFATTSGQLADAIAQDMGYDNYDDYALAVENGTVVNRNAVEKWNAMSDKEKAKVAKVSEDKWQKMNAKKRNEVFNKFAAEESKGFEVDRRRLEAYETAKELRPFIGEDGKTKSGTDQWARDIAQYYEDYGDAVYDWLRVHGLLYTDDTDDDEIIGDNSGGGGDSGGSGGSGGNNGGNNGNGGNLPPGVERIG